ncbi:MAG: PhnD/SsuA/transferrin family substrate-binding protein, partial [Gammaproteobacteria bacterium]
VVRVRWETPAKAGGIGRGMVAVHAENSVYDVEHLSPGIRLAFTDDPDVRMMGMIMLEPGDLDTKNIQSVPCDTYVLVAKHLLREEADVGIFLAEAFDDLSEIIKKQLKVLVRSQISVIHHSLMIGPKLLNRRDAILDCLLQMPNEPKGQGVLESLNFKGWDVVDDEEMEFMIDLMDTLTI